VYRIKIWWLCNSKTSHSLGRIPYTDIKDNTRTIKLVQEIVENLCSLYFWRNRKITMDNYFTSKNLDKSLLSVRQNKVCIPPELWPKKKTGSAFNYIWLSEKCNYCVSCKAVIFLSTMHHVGYMTDKMIKLYQKQISIMT